MKKLFIIAAVLLPLLSLPALSAKSSPPPRILSFDHMYAVDGPFLGDAHSIRGVAGDELPWTIERSAKGTLDTNGHLRIQVRGLVFTDDPEVPPEDRGTNDEATFRGLVSCVTEISDTEVGMSNVMTQGFPATPDGNSTIDAFITLPNPCVAPIVFIMAGSEDKWFAVTGFESGE